MKKILITLLIVFTAGSASWAQFRVGPYLAYGEGLNRWGIGVYTEVAFNDRVSIAPTFTQYFPENFDNNPRVSGWELNGNVNYYVITREVGYLYGLAGLNYTNIRTRISVPGDEEIDRDGNVGFNFGIGTMFNINDFLYPFAEGKYTAGGFSQANLLFGVKFQLGRRSIAYDY